MRRLYNAGELVWTHRERFCFEKRQKVEREKPSIVIGIIKCVVDTKEKEIALQRKFFERRTLVIPRGYEKKRRETFLLGRIAAKISIEELNRDPEFEINREKEKKENSLPLRNDNKTKEIKFRQGFLGNPQAYCEGIGRIKISITHDGSIGISVAWYGEELLGIDFCIITKERERAFEHVVESEEDTLLEEGESRSVIWCAKEALSKSIGCGRHVRQSILTVSKIKKIASVENYEKNYEISYKNFVEMKGIFVRKGDKGICIVTPRIWIEAEKLKFSEWMGSMLKKIP